MGLVFSAVSFCLFVVIHNVVLSIKKRGRPPGPLGFPILGSVNLALGDKVENFGKLHKKYGPIIEVEIAGMTVVSVASFDLIKEVTMNDVFNARPVLSEKGMRLLGFFERGVGFNNSLDRWKASRSIVLGIANSSVFLQRVAHDLFATFEESTFPSLKSESQSGGVVIMSQVIGSHIVIFLEKVFFNRANQLNADDNFSANLSGFLKALNYFFFTPEMLWPFVGDYKGHVRAVETWYNMQMTVIRERRAEILKLDADGLQQANDLISIIAREGHRYQEMEDVKDSVISDEVIRETMNEVLIGAFDTIWNTLSFMVWLLSHHQDAQTKLRAELKEFLRNNPRPDVKDVTNSLPYLEAVILETFRFAPTVNMIIRAARKETTLGGFNLKGGTTVILQTEFLSTNPENFENADKFIPERWFDEQSRANSKLLMPFGGGKRNCPGQSFGYLMLRSLAILFFSSVKMTAAPGSEKLKCTYEIARHVHEDSTKVYLELAQ